MDIYKPYKKAKSKAKVSHESTPTLFAMGYFDLIFKIKFSKKDLLKSDEDLKKVENSENNEENGEQENEIDDRYYHIDDLNKIEDLQFLKNKKELWDKISLSGGNETLKQLLIGNRISKRRCKIEYFAFNRPIFEENESFFSEIFNYICAKNHLYINETPLEESARFTLKIILEHKGETNIISIGRSFEEEEKERIKKKIKKKREKELQEQNNENSENEGEEKEKEENKEEDSDEESEDDDEEDDEDENKKPDEYEETEAMKAKKIPKFKRAGSILVKLEPKCDKFSMAYINYTDVKRVPGDFKMSDLLELLKFFKSKGTTIFVNFYRPKKPKIEIEEEELETHENDNEIMDEGKTKTVPTEEVEEDEDKKEKKEQEGPSRKMRELNELYDITNMYFFDTKQCKKIFNKHYQTFTTDNIINRKKINRANIFDYFIKGIAPATKEEVSGIKTGLFIEALNKLTIIYCSKKAASKQEFDIQPHPKINHNNMSLVIEYKDILKNNKNDYYSMLLSSILIHGAASAPNCQSTDVIYPSFLISLEVIKKKLECEKNHYTPDDNIYKVKIDEKVILKNLAIFASGGKENGFVLDCTNKQKSKLKDYVSLYDYHLKNFFASEMIRNNLHNKGFINSKGFVMFDPIHRNIMREMNKKKKKIISEEEMKNKVMSSINGIDVPGNIKDKEIDSKKLAKSKNFPTKIKLPINKELALMQSTKKKHNKKKHKANSMDGNIGENNNNSGNMNGGDE